MKIGVIIAALLGVALGTAVIGYVGFHAVFASLVAVGWKGFFVYVGYSLLVIPILGAAWFVVTPGGGGRPLRTFVWSRMVRDAASDVLPFSALGGVFIGSRAAILDGLSAEVTYGSVVVDLTTELLAQIAYTAVGLALLSWRLSSASMTNPYVGPAAVGLMIALAATVGFVVAQKRGFKLMDRLATQFLPAAVVHTRGVHEVVASIYRQPVRMLAGLLVHFIAWIASAMGAWIVLSFMGVRIAVWDVVAIESLLYAAKSAAFVVPNAVGVQEGAYAVLGPLFGLTPELAIALSLIKRAKDLTIGVPALLVWQAFESRRVLQSRGKAANGVDREKPPQGPAFVGVSGKK